MTIITRTRFLFLTALVLGLLFITGTANAYAHEEDADDVMHDDDIMKTRAEEMRDGVFSAEMKAKREEMKERAEEMREKAKREADAKQEEIKLNIETERERLKTDAKVEREGIKANAKILHETLKAEVKVRREEIKASIEEKREEFKHNSEERHEMRAERKEMIEANLKENAVARIQMFLENFTNILDAAIARMYALVDRITARADILDADGIDTSVAREYLDLAVSELSAAGADLASIEADLEVTLSLGVEELTREALKDAFADTKDALQSAKEHIRAAHKALRDAVRALRDAADSPADAEGPVN